jgi:hypothetical protein
VGKTFYSLYAAGVYDVGCIEFLAAISLPKLDQQLQDNLLTNNIISAYFIAGKYSRDSNSLAKFLVYYSTNTIR